MIDKLDKSKRPTKEDLIRLVENENNVLLRDVCAFIETGIKGKEQIDYSTCSGAPGWNLKYKKGGKSVCTIYPEKEKFIVLITLNFDAVEVFNVIADSFTPYIQESVKRVKPFNGSKWLMIEVESLQIAEDVKKLISLKSDISNKK